MAMAGEGLLLIDTVDKLEPVLRYFIITPSG